jgi:hypothetical protein
MTVALIKTLILRVRGLSKATQGFLTHRNNELMNAGCFESLSLAQGLPLDAGTISLTYAWLPVKKLSYSLHQKTP